MILSCKMSVVIYTLHLYVYILNDVYLRVIMEPYFGGLYFIEKYLVETYTFRSVFSWKNMLLE